MLLESTKSWNPAKYSVGFIFTLPLGELIFVTNDLTKHSLQRTSDLDSFKMEHFWWLLMSISVERDLMVFSSLSRLKSSVSKTFSLLAPPLSLVTVFATSSSIGNPNWNYEIIKIYLVELCNNIFNYLNITVSFFFHRIIEILRVVLQLVNRELKYILL